MRLFKAVVCLVPSCFQSHPSRSFLTNNQQCLLVLYDCIWCDYIAFWSSPAFVDMATATSDSQAFELERRTIQSLYLMRSQEAGSMPPQESGLLYNSWTGKHHSEVCSSTCGSRPWLMRLPLRSPKHLCLCVCIHSHGICLQMRYWHQTWMPLWSRPELLRRSDEWFLQSYLE